MKSKYHLIVLPVFIFLFNINRFAQFNQFGARLPDGLSLSNQLEYSYDVDNTREIFENWLNLDYRKGIFTAGLRFEVFQPNDPDPSIFRGKKRFAGIDYKYINAEIGDAREGGEITVGNYYALFGRGLLLKSYENRNIRVDNNLLGVKVEGRYAGFKLKALTGMAENFNAERKDILHAVDLEFKGIRNFTLGGSFVSNMPEVENAARTTLASVRVQPSIWNFDFYGEYGIKQNEDVQENVFNNNESIIGRAIYGSGNFYIGSFSLTSEYKYYDNFSFTSNDGTIYYNTPPAVRKEYTYILLNRHPSPLNQSNEQGFQLEGSYYFGDYTYLTANYGLTKTLPSSSFYQRQLGINNPVRTALEEAFVLGGYEWSDDLHLVGAFGYMEELSTNTKSITPVLEARYYFNNINTIKLVVEHQQTTDKTTGEQYYDDVVSLEYLRSPKLNISLVGEMQTKEPQPGNVVRKFFGFIQVGYKIGYHTDISVLFGSREAGNICIGGVCRYEPKFSGIELKMLTRF